jgi:hypothetical protein
VNENRPILTDAMGMAMGGNSQPTNGPPQVLVQFFLNTATVLMQREGSDPCSCVEQAWDATKLAFGKFGVQIQQPVADKQEKGA